MTNDDLRNSIGAIGRENGWIDTWILTPQQLLVFAKSIAAFQREECAAELLKRAAHEPWIDQARLLAELWRAKCQA